MKTPLVKPGQEFWGWMHVLVCAISLIVCLFLDNKYLHMVV